MSTTILVVDDEPRYLRLMEANLITEGFNVLKASNGQEAVDIVVEHHPDLILLDVMMPVLDGDLRNTGLSFMRVRLFSQRRRPILP